MKVFVSADIEGVAGATSRDDCTKGSPEYRQFQAQMDAEVAAACQGALAAGATDIVVKDAHGDGRNLSAAALPAPARLVRGYNGHPFAMVQGLDATFQAALFVGYHAGAGDGGNPLSHTLSSRKLHAVTLNGEPLSELAIHTWAAASVGVPVVLVTGDEAICAEAEKRWPATVAVAVKSGAGASTTSLHPADAVAAIRAGAEAALGVRPPAVPDLPAEWHLEVTYRDVAAAYVRAFYPGAEALDARTLAIDCRDCFELLRALVFLVGL